MPARNSADLPPPVLAVSVADTGTVEEAKMLHSSLEEPAGSQQAGSQGMRRLSLRYPMSEGHDTVLVLEGGDLDSVPLAEAATCWSYCERTNPY